MVPSRADWRRLALVALVVFATGIPTYREFFFATGSEADLATYAAAFDLVAAQRSPYDNPGFLYPPAFAVAGDNLREVLGWRGFQLAFRSANLAGIALLVWASLLGSPYGWRIQAAIAFAVTLSPPVANGVGCGNATPMLLGLVAAALRVAERHPGWAGLVAGGANALKPLALPALAAGVSARGSRPWAWRFTAAAAAVGVSSLFLGGRYLPDMLARAGGFPDAYFNLSFVRALGLLGVELPPALVFVAVSGVGILVARRFAADLRERLAVGLVAALFALPVIGTSAFLFSLPIQVLAVEALLRRRRESRTSATDRRWAWAVLALVPALILSINGAEGGVGADDFGPRLHGLVMLIPFVDVLALTAYVLTRRPAASADAEALVASNACEIGPSPASSPISSSP